MRVIRYHDRDEFTRRVRPFLLAREAENCFFLGFIRSPQLDPATVLLLAEDAGEVAAVAVKSPARHVMITSAPPDAVDAIARYFVESKIELPGVQSRRH